VCVLGLVGPTVAERTSRGRKQLVDKVETTILYVNDLVSGATISYSIWRPKTDFYAQDIECEI